MIQYGMVKIYERVPDNMEALYGDNLNSLLDLGSLLIFVKTEVSLKIHIRLKSYIKAIQAEK